MPRTRKSYGQISFGCTSMGRPQTGTTHRRVVALLEPEIIHSKFAAVSFPNSEHCTMMPSRWLRPSGRKPSISSGFRFTQPADPRALRSGSLLQKRIAVEELVFNAHSNRFPSELGRRGCVTGVGLTSESRTWTSLSSRRTWRPTRACTSCERLRWYPRCRYKDQDACGRSAPKCWRSPFNAHSNRFANESKR